MAKVHQGLISVRCSELRDVRFSEVRNVFYGKINWGQVSRPLYRGCPLFGGSVIRGFAVIEHLSVFDPKAGINTLYGFSPEEEMFPVGSYKWGF